MGEAKLASIHSIEDKIARERETFDEKKKMILALIARSREQTVDRLEELAEEMKELENHIAGADVIVQENEMLHTRVKELSREHANLKQQWAEQIDHMKQKSFDTRVKLEDVFRNTIKVFDKDSRKAAIALMEEEASSAERQNKILLQELKNNEAICVKLMKEQLWSVEALDKLELEKEVVSTNISVQDEIASKLDGVTKSKTNKLGKLEEKIESLQEQVEMYRKKCTLKEEMTDCLDFQTTCLQGEMKKLKECKKECVDLAKSLVEDAVIMMDKDLHSVTNFERFLPYIDAPVSPREEFVEKNIKNETFNDDMIWNSDYQQCTYMSGPLREFLKINQSKQKTRNRSSKLVVDVV